MKQENRDQSPSLSVRAQVREVSAAESRALRDRQIAAVGRLLRRAALISKHGAPPAIEGDPQKPSRRQKRRR
ncbi:MAG: hypothetical protein WA862_01655 [Solirubrobacterales bacterium]